MSGHRFKPENADKLLSDDRKQRLPYDQVIDRLALDPNDVVADLGAGNGYFTIPMANHTEETVYAVDIELKMLEMLKKRAKETHVENIEYVNSDLETIPMDDHSIDKVLIAFVIHEVPSVVNTLNEIKRILKPGGTVMVIEWEAVESEDGPPLHERLASKELMKVLQDHGFQATPYQLNAINYAIEATVN
ncbi:class I SAM-dependent methyltransferase [Tuberibacillus sp. Marseille-P3662]|uniref:class I SAM-dependent methyltransferase n=1 Tax=Tuberibacillus sp. Marseille-P3662 TaxID=1965358 RepID=UPI000A1C8842|nr:methyltransferase domain-containing protein [Tuberibacillus sp. Marseille-P3662]